MTAMDKIVADDPIVSVYEDWKGIQTFLVRVLDNERSFTSDDPVVVEAYTKQSELERKLTSMTPRTAQGLSCLLELFWVNHGPSFSVGSENWIENMGHPEMQLLCRIKSGAHQLAQTESQA